MMKKLKRKTESTICVYETYLIWISYPNYNQANQATKEFDFFQS